MSGDSCLACGFTRPGSGAFEALPPDEDLSAPSGEPVVEGEPLDLVDETSESDGPEPPAAATAPMVEDPLDALGDLDLSVSGPSATGATASGPFGGSGPSLEAEAPTDDPFTTDPFAVDDPFAGVPLGQPAPSAPESAAPDPEPEPDDDPLGTVSLLETMDPFAAGAGDAGGDPDFDPLAAFDDIPSLEAEEALPKPSSRPDEELSVDVDDMFDSIQVASVEGPPVEPGPEPAPAPAKPKAANGALDKRLLALAFALRSEGRDGDADLLEEAAARLKGVESR